VVQSAQIGQNKRTRFAALMLYIQQPPLDSHQGDRLLRSYLLDLYRAGWHRSHDCLLNQNRVQ